MSVFADASSWFALASSIDEEHAAAASRYRDLVDRGADLITSSYTLAETIALFQS